MESMYANRITLTVNEKEAFFKFDLVAPAYDPEQDTTSERVADSKSIIMTKDALVRVRDLINDCLRQGSEKE